MLFLFLQIGTGETGTQTKTQCQELLKDVHLVTIYNTETEKYTKCNCVLSLSGKGKCAHRLVVEHHLKWMDLADVTQVCRKHFFNIFFSIYMP